MRKKNIQYLTIDEITELIRAKIYVVAICKEGYVVYDGDFKLLDKIEKIDNLEQSEYPYNQFKNFIRSNNLTLIYH